MQFLCHMIHHIRLNVMYFCSTQRLSDTMLTTLLCITNTRVCAMTFCVLVLFMWFQYENSLILWLNEDTY